MLLRNLVVRPSGQVYKVPLYSLGNFESETTVLGYNFTITVRTYVDYYSYFNIMINNDVPLCIMTLARLGVNLVAAPIVTIDSKRHVFYLVASDHTVTKVHHSLFGDGIDLYYFQCPTYSILESIVL